MIEFLLEHWVSIVKFFVILIVALPLAFIAIRAIIEKIAGYIAGHIPLGDSPRRNRRDRIEVSKSAIKNLLSDKHLDEYCIESILELIDLEERNNMSAEIIIAGISATLTAIQTWLAEKNRQEAKKAFDKRYKASLVSTETEEQAIRLVSLVPEYVLDSMGKRVKLCWTKYKNVLDKEEEYLPDEVDDATIAVKKCICREIRRIYDLTNGNLPPGEISEWWSAYCA